MFNLVYVMHLYIRELGSINIDYHEMLVCAS